MTDVSAPAGVSDESAAMAQAESDTAELIDESAPKQLGSFLSHAFLAMAFHKLNKPENAARHRAVLDSIEEASKSENLDWQERLRRKLLRAEINAMMGETAATTADTATTGMPAPNATNSLEKGSDDK